MPMELARRSDVDLARKDELRTVPIFNYSRAFTTPATAELVLKNAAANVRRGVPSSRSADTGSSSWVECEKGDIDPASRVATDDEVIEYCTRSLEWNSGSSTTLEGQLLTMASDDAYTSRDHGLIIPSRWAPGIWTRVVIASLLALGLQWGTISAAIMVNYIAPPLGFRCSSFSLLPYGALGTLSFFFLLTSSILAHMSRPVPGEAARLPQSRIFQNVGAVVFRWIGKCLAVVSGVCILEVCFLHVSGLLDSCFCMSVASSKGRSLVKFAGQKSTPIPSSSGVGLLG